MSNSNDLAILSRIEKAADALNNGSGINPKYISNVENINPLPFENDGLPVGEKPITGKLKQRLEWNANQEEWQNLGEPIPTKDYVDDKSVSETALRDAAITAASAEKTAEINVAKGLLQSEIDADVLAEKTRAETAEGAIQVQLNDIGTRGYEASVATQAILYTITDANGVIRKVTNDATASNNGSYRADSTDGNGWVKFASFGATVLDPTSEVEVQTGKAVGDYAMKKTGSNLQLVGAKVVGESTTSGDNVPVSASDYERSGFIPVIKNETLTITMVASASNPIKGYDVDQNWVVDLYATDATRTLVEDVSIQIPINVHYIVGSSAYDNSAGAQYPKSPLIINRSINNALENALKVIESPNFAKVPTAGVRFDNPNGNIYGTHSEALYGSIKVDSEGLKEGGVVVLVWSGDATPVFTTDLDYTVIGSVTSAKKYVLYLNYFFGKFIVNITDGVNVTPLKSYFEFLEANTDQVNYAINFDASEDFYIETVCRLNTVSGHVTGQTYFGSYDISYPDTFRCLFGAINGKIAAPFENAGGALYTGVDMVLNTWYKIRLSYRGSDKRIKVFVDGAFQIETTLTGIVDHTFNFPIGKSELTGTSGDFDIDYLDFNGVKFDFNEIVSVSKAITSTEVEYQIVSDRADLTTILKTEEA